MIVAHIERYECLNSMSAAARMKRRHESVSFQVNAATVTKSAGLWRDHVIWGWFQDGLIDYVASDAHDPERRPFAQCAALRRLRTKVLEGYAEALFEMKEQLLFR